MITIIDYGLGNLTSVKNALEKLEIPVQISSDPTVIKNAQGLILPGVGAAGEGMRNLQQRGLEKVIVEYVRSGKPLLGICLGMQLLFSQSEEGNVDCLNIVKGKVKKFATDLKVPQIGWNQVRANSRSKLFKDVLDDSYFYFVHSYYCEPDDKAVIIGQTDYNQTFCSVLEVKNIFGVQFHPEKSSEAGLQLLNNFGKRIC